MPIKKAWGRLKSYSQRKKTERQRGRAIEKNVRAITSQKKSGISNVGAARNIDEMDDQRACIAAQLMNGHIPEGMGVEEAFSFVDPQGWDERRSSGDSSDI